MAYFHLLLAGLTETGEMPSKNGMQLTA